MTDYLWKHLPYAIYLDTNALRTAGPNLDATWINELLSITNEYDGISVCISELVLSEWSEHIIGVLEVNRQKLLSAMALLRHFGISVPDIKPSEICLPGKSQLVGVVSDMMKAAGFTVIPNWDAPLSRLLNEAVTKRPPFDHGGKGLCDAVILESYAEHAKENANSRVLVISNDGAVKRSAERFKDREIAVDFVSESEIVAKLKSLLGDELSAYIEATKSKLTAYVQVHEPEVLDFIRRTPVEITDWTIKAPLAEQFDCINGTVESILSIRPVRIIDVIGGAPTYGEETAKNRYSVRISVEIELEIVVTEPGGGPGLLAPLARTIVQPDLLDRLSPVSLNKNTYDWKPREIVKTIRRALTVIATIDAQKEKNDVFDDLRLEKVI